MGKLEKIFKEEDMKVKSLDLLVLDRFMDGNDFDISQMIGFFAVVIKKQNEIIDTLNERREQIEKRGSMQIKWLSPKEKDLKEYYKPMIDPRPN